MVNSKASRGWAISSKEEKMGFFYRNKKNIIIGSVVLLGVVFGLNELFGNSLVKMVLNPVLSKTSEATQNASDFVDRKYIHDEKQMEISRLEEENAKLRKDLIELTMAQKDISELNELKKILNYKEEEIYESYLAADLIAKEGNDFYTAFLISAGKDDGVKKGDLVLSGNGLAGVVQEAQKDYSKILSILDSQISISFKAVRSDDISGIVSQNIDSEAFKDMPEGMLRGYVFDNAEVLAGDIIMTSGMGIYPAGIEIGEVYQVIEDQSNLLKYVVIRPYTNFNVLSKLLVVSTRVLD